MPDGEPRHILGISGGKDSAALAIHMRDRAPQMEYFFCDTGAELPETYEYLTRLEAVLGKPIERLNADRTFDHWFEVFRGALPSPQMRWCTKNMKIKPLEQWIGDDHAISYVAIRADERNRKGYISTRSNIEAVFPFVDEGVYEEDVYKILEGAGVGIPDYYDWRSRSGCYFCFYQRKIEWVRLGERHPELFERAVRIEQKVLSDAGVDGDADFRAEAMKDRQYTWSGGETLTELWERREEIKQQEQLRQERVNQAKQAGSPLAAVLADDAPEDGCTMCHV